MGAVKSGVNIIINSGDDNTLASVTADINDPSFIEEVLPNVFVVKGNRYFSVYNPATLTIGNPDDYSEAITLGMTPTSNNGARLYLPYPGGGKVKVYGNATIDLSYGTNIYPLFYMWGPIEMRGDGVNNPTIKGGYQTNWYGIDDPLTDDKWTDAIQVFDNVNFHEGYSLAQAYYLYYQIPQYLPRDYTFKDCTFDFNPGVPHVRGATYGIAWAGNTGVDWSRQPYENCTIHRAHYPVLSSGANAHMKNCVFDDNARYIRVNEPCAIRPDKHTDLDTYPPYTRMDQNRADGQQFFFIEGCTIRGGYNNTAVEHGIYVSDNGTLLLKDTHITSGLSGAAITSANGGRIHLWTGNTLLKGDGNPNPVIVGFRSACYKVFALDLIITDTDGNPIENAIVSCQQNDGYEAVAATTGADGRPKTYYPLDGKLILVNSELWDAGGDFLDPAAWVDWSAAGHTVTIAAAGYFTTRRTYTMDQDRAETIQLVAGVEPTTVYAKEINLVSSW